MPEEFYTLEQAAARLGVTPEQLRQMAQRNEVRVFVDRGTWRFRASEIEEMRRRLGKESSSELQAAGPRTPKPGSGASEGGPRSPKPGAAPPADGPRTPKPGQSPQPPSSDASGGRETMLATPDVFPFEIGGEPGGVVDLASLFAQGPRAPGTDSDVRLVAEGSDINLVVLPPEAEKPPSSPSSEKGKPESQVRIDPAQPVAEGPRPRLSALQVGPMESDSDVRLVDVETPQIVSSPGPGRRDSQIRLEPDHRSGVKPDSGVQAEPRSPEGSDSTLQLEVNLDEEIQRAEERKRAVSDSSEERAAAEMLGAEGESTDFEGQGSEFELKLPDEETEEVATAAGESDTFRLKEEDEDVAKGPAADSSSNRSLALDAGEGSATEELSFELSLDEEATEVTPRPESAKRTADSSSEFELSVQEEGDSDVDTELLGAAGGQAERSVQESDTELEETSDFDLQLVEEEETPAGGKESDRDTEVIIDEGASAEEETQLVEDVADELTDLGLEDAGLEFVEPGSSEVIEAEEEVAVAAEEAPAVRYVELAPADWGLWALVHVPTTLVLVFAGLLMFELVRSALYYHEPGMMGGQIFEMLANLFRR
ncbi:hypothetical protein HRbin36_02307 [bacterium HR36]|nr:hypothetical protein HRbin36_02307 [bacterium HR36]